MDVSWEASFERRANCLVEYQHRVAVRDATGTFFIRGELALIYALSATSDFSDDQLHGFGEVSVAFSAFPYVRELVHTLTTRASLPPLILGTLRSPLDPPASLASNARGQGVKQAAKPKRSEARSVGKERGSKSRSRWSTYN